MRKVEHVMRAHDAMDGAGVKIKRVSLVHQSLADPFLLLDELRSDDPSDFVAGFPPHPHRGIETLTYIRVGGLQHEDHMGNQGEISSGGAQWMSAGKGVIHSEMPLKDNQKLHGFQLWINLSAAQKMKAPDYRDVPKKEIPVVENASYSANVIAGRWELNGQKVAGPLDALAAHAGYLDLELKPNGQFVQDIPRDHQVVIYVYEGEVFADQVVKEQSVALFGAEGELVLNTQTGAKLLILHGLPHKEPIANYGPFVMNTMEEIDQAVKDYQNGVLTD